MSFFDKLQSLIKIGSLVKVDLSKLRNFHIFNKNNLHGLIQIDNSTKTINVNIANADSKSEKQLISTIKQALLDDNLIIEDKAKKLLDDFQKVDKSQETINIIEYFRGKISSTDLDILRASIYIKDVFSRGQSVRELKSDLIGKYGQRGNNISNLYSAGYFKSLIKPIYEEMNKMPDFFPVKFLERFEVIVTQYTFAVFVSATRKKEDIKQEILNKIALNKKYGIRKLNIHGIGEYNVERIKEILIEIKSELNSIPDLNSGTFYINATINF